VAVNEEHFSRQIAASRDRASMLYRYADESLLQHNEVLPLAVEELRNSLEELHIAEEELRQQNEELLATRQQLELERQRYHDLFEFSPDGYLVTDANGNIQEANRTAAELLNLPSKYLVGKPLLSFVPQEERQAFLCQLNRLHTIDCSQEWELHLMPRQGVQFEAAITIATIRDRQGNAVALRLCVRDITARKQAEEQIRNMQIKNLQLIEEARLKSQFLGIMSHELRTPLNAIIGFSQVLLRQLKNHLTAQQQSMVERILNNGKNLLSLIDDILDLSTIKAAELELKLQIIDLPQLVGAVTEDLRSLAEQKQLSMQVRINLQNTQIVNDSDRLRQVLVNLLSNAIKFTECGNVWIEVWELSSDRIAIALTDTGIGIADADVVTIFKEFRQLNQTNTRSHGGTGLGLAITDSLVRLMNGNIRVESKLGQGSTFRVELPRKVSLGAC
jgi:PAS domain S-box-containing protein